MTGLQPAELLPLQPGNTWTYTVTAKVDVPACIEGVRVVTATGGPTEFEGRQAYTLTSLCQDQDTRMALDDGEVLEWIPNFWARALPAPVEAGFTWSSGAGRYTWTDVGSITVPAGTFSDCWERTSADPLVQTNTYCAGVGMVRADEQGHEAVLTSYVVQ